MHFSLHSALKETPCVVCAPQHDTEVLFRPGDVIVDAVSCLPVLDPLANENTGGIPGQFTRAQHAVTVALVITETALVHLAAGVPE